MPQFKLQPQESAVIGVASFDKASDFKTITLNNSEEPILVHVVLADKLIKKGAAKEAKGAKIEEKEPNMISTKVKDK